MKKQNLIYVFLLILLSITVGQNVYAVDKKYLSAFLANTKAPVYSIKIVNTYPHDPDAFTQGLIYHDGFLYESTGLRGKSSLRKVDLTSGRIVKTIKLSNEYFAEGITYFDNKIYQLTWTNEIGFVYDFQNFKKTRIFHYGGEGWGITTDGKKFFMSNGTAVITCRKAKSFEIIDEITVRDGHKLITNINELEFIKGEIWANIFMEDVIARISPISGRVLGWIDLSPLYSKIPKYYKIDVLNGIAYDEKNDRIFVTGKNWPYLFEVKVHK